VQQITVPWARKSSKFTLLFEQGAMVLARKMPVLSAARILEMQDKRLWRIIQHYVNQALAQMELGGLKVFSLDETKSRRGHLYITVFMIWAAGKNQTSFARASGYWIWSEKALCTVEKHR